MEWDCLPLFIYKSADGVLFEFSFAVNCQIMEKHMSEMPGMIRPELQALPQIRDRMMFLYFEHCKLNRQDSAITVTDDQGIIHVLQHLFQYCF